MKSDKSDMKGMSEKGKKKFMKEDAKADAKLAKKIKKMPGDKAKKK